MELKNYDNWKLDIPKHYDYEDCGCDEPDIEERYCGCLSCEDCGKFLLCDSCGQLEKYGL